MTKKARELRQQAARCLDDAQALIDAAMADDGDGLTDEIRKKVKELREENAKLVADAEMIEELEARRASQILSDSQSGDAPPRMPITDNKSAERKETFGEWAQAAFMATSPVRFQQLRGIVGERIVKRATGMSEGVGADGGLLVETEHSQELMKVAFETGKLPGRCREMPIGPNSNGIKFNGFNETSRATGSRYGGIQSYWLNEGGTKTASKPSFRQVELSLKKLIGMYYATDELLQDAPALGKEMSEAFGNEFGWMLDDSIMNGLGGGQPLGIMNSGALITVPAEAGQGATTFIAENAEKMYARLLPQSLSRAAWFINQDVWPQLFQLHHAVGTGGVPLFVPQNSLANSPYSMLLGLPIIALEQAQTLGTSGDVVLADCYHMRLATKGGVDSASSIHVQFTTDETVVRFVLRVDARPDLASPLTPANGTNTLSPFIVMESR